MRTIDYKRKKNVNSRGDQWFLKGLLQRDVTLEYFWAALDSWVNEHDLRNYAVAELEKVEKDNGVSILIQGQLQWKRGCPKSRKTIEDLLISRTSNFTLRKEKVSLMKRKNLILHLNGSKRTLKGVHSEIIPTASENFDYILSVSDRIYHSKKFICQGGSYSYTDEDSSDNDTAPRFPMSCNTKKE
jgi:hypothetical protein